MNLRHLTDNTLLVKTKTLAVSERKVLTELLYHILEVERRRLFSDLKCSSLSQYMVKILGYAEDEANRRISAMRLLKSMPEIQEKIEHGVFNLTNLNLVRTLFRQEKFSTEKQREVMREIENKSTREAKRVLQTFSSKVEPEVLESIKELADGSFAITIVVDKETKEALDKLKGLLAHICPSLTYGALMQKLTHFGFRNWDPAQRKTAAPRVVKPKSVSSYIAALVWRRAKSQCEFCASYYALQVDHIKPKALGGSDEPVNLRLLCRSCNQRAAIKVFGVQKMQKYLQA